MKNLSDTNINSPSVENRASYRTIIQRFEGIQTADGAGVKLTRIIGSPYLNMLDPFLLLDCFESDNSADYIGGFPTHPHRGFETVTYMLDGLMEHKDSAGNQGVIESGSVQWMTAGKGILHSEMPAQSQGLLKGFQLWVNLPASAKMTEPNYQEFPADQIAIEQLDNGSTIKVIAGTTNQGTTGAVINDYTQPIYLDVKLTSDSALAQDLPVGHNSFIYLIDGELTLLDKQGNLDQPLTKNELGVLSLGEKVSVKASSKGARFLLIAGKPLNEPVVRGGPFVMNTKSELMQAFADYSAGRF